MPRSPSCPWVPIIAGNAVTDGHAGAAPAVVADLLGLPQLTHVRALPLDTGRVRAERDRER